MRVILRPESLIKSRNHLSIFRSTDFKFIRIFVQERKIYSFWLLRYWNRGFACCCFWG